MGFVKFGFETFETEVEGENSFFFEYGEMLAKFCLCFDDTLSAHSHTLNTYHL